MFRDETIIQEVLKAYIQFEVIWILRLSFDKDISLIISWDGTKNMTLGVKVLTQEFLRVYWSVWIQLILLKIETEKTVNSVVGSILNIFFF